ncbi:MAG: ectonucleotide pyrophosphatase/phosphodiesterase [Chitinophagales bacterium]
MIRRISSLLVFIAIFFTSHSPAQDTVQKIIPSRSNGPEQQKKPYVILISADGFRYDLAEKYKAKNLLSLRERGVQAEYMEPSFPSLTFPNHYTLITGLYPAHHGLVDNNFYDPKKMAGYSMSNKKAVADSSWYGGTPLWVLAESQNMLSASFYWVASEAAIQSTRPTYYYTYNEAISMDRRIAIVKNWLQLPPGKRPHFINFYIPEVDHQEHRFGVDSKEASEAVQDVDQSIGQLVRTVDSLGLPVNFIFLADHGMTTVDTLSTLTLPATLDTSAFIIPFGFSLIHLYAKDPSKILPAYQLLKKEARGYDVFLPDETPSRWHYRRKDDLYGRLGDIILAAHPPQVFNINRRHVPIGEHGFDPAFTDMRASFYAWGPAFVSHKKIPGFSNVNVYPLIARILGLQVRGKIDGSLKVLKEILR